MSFVGDVFVDAVITDDQRTTIRNSIVEIISKIDEMTCTFNTFAENENNLSPEDLYKIDRLAAELNLLYSHLELCKNRLLTSLGLPKVDACSLAA